jgi:hypothetical protein
MIVAKFVAFLWLTGCGFDCNTSGLPKFPVFDSREHCERIVKAWVDEQGGYRNYDWGWGNEGNSRYGKRHGECKPV